MPARKGKDAAGAVSLPVKEGRRRTRKACGEVSQAELQEAVARCLADSFSMLNDYQQTCEVRDGQTLEEAITELKMRYFAGGTSVTHKQLADLREKYADDALPDDILVSDKTLEENKKGPQADLITPLQLFRHKTRPNRGHLIDWMEAATTVTQRDRTHVYGCSPL